MTRLVVIVCVVALIAASAATASVHWWVMHAGVACGFGTGPQGRGVACIRSNQKGYAVTLTATKVVVWLDKKVVFTRQQP